MTAKQNKADGNAGSWISVRDRLPEMSRASNGAESDAVLIYDWVTREIATAYLRDDGVWKDTATSEWEHDVSHWMPLPDPLKLLVPPED